MTLSTTLENGPKTPAANINQSLSNNGHLSAQNGQRRETSYKEIQLSAFPSEKHLLSAFKDHGVQVNMDDDETRQGCRRTASSAQQYDNRPHEAVGVDDTASNGGQGVREAGRPLVEKEGRHTKRALFSQIHTSSDSNRVSIWVSLSDQSDNIEKLAGKTEKLSGSAVHYQQSQQTELSIIARDGTNLRISPGRRLSGHFGDSIPRRQPIGVPDDPKGSDDSFESRATSCGRSNSSGRDSDTCCSGGGRRNHRHFDGCKGYSCSEDSCAKCFNNSLDHRETAEQGDRGGFKDCGHTCGSLSSANSGYGGYFSGGSGDNSGQEQLSDQLTRHDKRKRMTSHHHHLKYKDNMGERECADRNDKHEDDPPDQQPLRELVYEEIPDNYSIADGAGVDEGEAPPLPPRVQQLPPLPPRSHLMQQQQRLNSVASGANNSFGPLKHLELGSKLLPSAEEKGRSSGYHNVGEGRFRAEQNLFRANHDFRIHTLDRKFSSPADSYNMRTNRKNLFRYLGIETDMDIVKAIPTDVDSQDEKKNDQIINQYHLEPGEMYKANGEPLNPDLRLDGTIFRRKNLEKYLGLSSHEMDSALQQPIANNNNNTTTPSQSNSKANSLQRGRRPTSPCEHQITARSRTLASGGSSSNLSTDSSSSHTVSSSHYNTGHSTFCPRRPMSRCTGIYPMDCLGRPPHCSGLGGGGCSGGRSLSAGNLRKFANDNSERLVSPSHFPVPFWNGDLDGHHHGHCPQHPHQSRFAGQGHGGGGGRNDVFSCLACLPAPLPPDSGATTMLLPRIRPISGEGVVNLPPNAKGIVAGCCQHGGNHRRHYNNMAGPGTPCWSDYSHYRLPRFNNNNYMSHHRKTSHCVYDLNNGQYMMDNRGEVDGDNINQDDNDDEEEEIFDEEELMMDHNGDDTWMNGEAVNAGLVADFKPPRPAGVELQHRRYNNNNNNSHYEAERGRFERRRPVSRQNQHIEQYRRRSRRTQAQTSSGGGGTLPPASRGKSLTRLTGGNGGYEREGRHYEDMSSSLFGREQCQISSGGSSQYYPDFCTLQYNRRYRQKNV